MSLLRRAAQRLSTAAVAASSSSSSSSSSVFHHPRHHQRLSPLPLLLRHHSNKPVDSVYGGPRPPIERTTLRKLASKYRRGERISVVTAYDYPSAVHVSQQHTRAHPLTPIRKVHERIKKKKDKGEEGTHTQPPVSPPPFAKTNAHTTTLSSPSIHARTQTQRCHPFLPPPSIQTPTTGRTCARPPSPLDLLTTRRQQVDLAGIDVCLVGDSAAMVVHGQGSSGHSFV